MTTRYLIFIAICAGVWVANGIYIREGLKKQIISEVYIHTGLGIFFSLLGLELTLGGLYLWSHLNLLWLKIIGFILYLPSAVLVFGGLAELKQRGRPEGHDPSHTTTLVETGVFRFVRQPITLGMTIWSIALIFIFQSIFSIILTVPSMYCFWVSARKEADYNVTKFGDAYKDYMKKVPMWNVFKGLKW
jgi:protein-S-isoprenylcysteine O-methyltransferase Ste14